MRDAENQAHHQGFTVYLEGHEGHQGNVLAHTFLSRIQRLILVLNRLERIHEDSATRKTDFEIIDADKRNPTTLTLKPVARVATYNPSSTLDWSLDQIEAVDRGQEPDTRIRSGLLRDMAEMAAASKDNGAKRFWINGHTDPIYFDEDFHLNALRISRKRALEETPTTWFDGRSIGEVVGDLRRVDDIEAENEVIIVPKTGSDIIKCRFPDSMRDEIGRYLFKKVKVKGTLVFESTSPHPRLVEIHEGGIEPYPTQTPSVRFEDLKGLFAGKRRVDVDWNSLIDV